MHHASKRRYSVLVNPDEVKMLLSDVGLCAACRHMRQITSDRGSVFYQCQLSATDSSFPKYPRLPVLKCRGYEQLPQNA
jgi:hypothetical protein